MLVLQFPLQKDSRNRRSAEGKIDNSSSAKNYDQTLGRKGIQRPDPETQKGKLNNVIYDDRHTILTA
jgi:hypothetical protein